MHVKKDLEDYLSDTEHMVFARGVCKERNESETMAELFVISYLSRLSYLCRL